MSATQPRISRERAPAEAATPHAAGGRALGRLARRAERLATRRSAVLVLAGASLLALLVFFVRPSYPNYDSYYSLLWGQELAAGRLPDYDVFRPPTPHPLATLLGAALTPFGGAADRILVLLSLGTYVALLALIFRFTQLLLGTLVAAAGVAVLLTRTDLSFFALRAVIDLPFLALVFAACVLELGRPRRGWPVLALLGLAGLLRPEAWVLAGLYFLWLVPGAWREPGRWRRLAGLAALTAVGPVTWVVADLVVTGQPFYSLTQTREVAGEFARQRSLPQALALIPEYVGGTEKIVNVIAGGLGMLFALWMLRRRAALPLALGAIGVAVFLGIAAVGLSVIPRYLALPSLLFNLGVGVALVGWAAAGDRGGRRVGAALALLALALVAWRAPSYTKDLQRLNGRSFAVQEQYQGLKEVLDDPRVVPLLGACGPITTPNHSAIPVVRFATGFGKEAIEAAVQQSGPPTQGLLLVAGTFFLETTDPPDPGRPLPDGVAQWWANYPLSGFRRVAANPRWQVWARCPAAGPQG